MSTISIDDAHDGMIASAQLDPRELHETLLAIARVYGSRTPSEIAVCDESTFGQPADEHGEPLPHGVEIVNRHGEKLTNTQVAVWLHSTVSEDELDDDEDYYDDMDDVREHL